jgi:hypothetical protein
MTQEDKNALSVVAALIVHTLQWHIKSVTV